MNRIFVDVSILAQDIIKSLKLYKSTRHMTIDDRIGKERTFD